MHVKAPEWAEQEKKKIIRWCYSIRNQSLSQSAPLVQVAYKALVEKRISPYGVLGLKGLHKVEEHFNQN